MTEETIEVATPDGFAVYTYVWTPDVPPRAVLQIVHGMAEHAGRYRRLAEALAPHGYAVIAHDHRGHGQTVHRASDLGFIAEEGGWEILVADTRAVTDEARRRFPGLSLAILGHSMGSYVVQSYLFTHDDVQAAVFSASAKNEGPLVAIGRRLARFEAWRLGPRGSSWLLQQMSFGQFARQIKDRRTGFDWISRDAAEVDAYIADPLCGFPVTATLWRDMLHAFKDLSDPTCVARVRSGLPLYAIGGGEDPAIDGEKGFRALEALWTARLDDATFQLYPESRHELLNDLNRDEVTEDLRAWLDRTLGA